MLQTKSKLKIKKKKNNNLSGTGNKDIAIMVYLNMECLFTNTEKVTFPEKYH